MTMRQPFGVVGCITPWNFPIAIPSWKIFPAIMAGNAVVLKPAEDTPLCALRFVEALEDAGLPAGVVNVVFGLGEEAGAALVEHPDVAAIYFTGSVDTGRIVSETCGRMLKKCSLELGRQERHRGARRRRCRARRWTARSGERSAPRGSGAPRRRD